MYQYLLFEIENQIGTITINRPDKMNALNIALLAELDSVVDRAIQSEEVRGVIITGSGNKAFAAGADIAEFADFSVEKAAQMAANGHRIFDKIEQSPKPFIAAVNGFALGGGCELAMACHMRVASETARFGQPEINLGLIPGYGGTQRLVRLIGLPKAIELLLTADMIPSNEAHRFGLVNHVTSAEELIPQCKSILSKIITKSPIMVHHILQTAVAYTDKSKNGFEMEIKAFGDCFGTQDFREGTSAFLEKRKATFSGK